LCSLGYTHYWKKEKKVNKKEYADALKDIAKIVKANSNILAGPSGDSGTKPEITPDIAFNGIEDESHESFVLPASGLGDFEFCKTAQKPYDEVVVAALARLAEVDGIKVSSDGSAADWEDGVKLASKVLGRKVKNPLALKIVESSFAEKIKDKYEIESAAKRILKRDVKLKDGRTYAKGTMVEVKFLGNIDKENGHRVCEIHTDTDSWKALISNLPVTVSGFVKPSLITMEKWSDEGYSKTPTGKKTEPDGYADDGSPSWLLALGLI